jgi:DNA-binding beta-propeller fold protein YncE
MRAQAARPVGRVAVIALLAFGVLAAPASGGDGPAFRYSLVDRLGGIGDGPGEFQPDSGPVGIAVDHLCGDIYVSDEAKRRVQRLDQNGKFLNYVGQPAASEDFTAAGELEEPLGLDVFVAVGPDNFYGPPTKCVGLTTLSTYVWVADLIANRVAIFEPSGSWVGSWCNTDLNVGGCDFVDAADYDYYPTDVDATSSRVYVAGVSSNWVREYDREGTYLRQTEPAVNGAYSTSVFGGQLWVTQRFNSTVGLYSLDPGNATINRYHELGSEFSSTAGSFTYATALTTAPDGRLFVLDNDNRVLTFLPSGRYLNEFDLPEEAVGEDIFARFDGTLYIADNSRTRPGILVYAPGPVVTLKLKARGGRRVEISGRVKKPAHPGARLTLQRLEADGWNRIARVRLEGRSRYEYEWKAPRERLYTVRAFFADPHDFHADRTSRHKKIRVD